MEVHACDERPPTFPNLAAECARRGISNIALARAVEIHPHTVTNIQGGLTNPSAALRARIALLLNVDINELFATTVEASA